MMRINFIIIGTQKSGTTALYQSMKLHPEVCMGTPKEVHFFDNDELYSRPSVDYAAYHTHFQPVSPDQLLGEATPAYLYWNPCAERIHAYHPGIKLIMILRNPIERAYSHWNMSVHRGVEPLSFMEALLQEKARLAGSPGGQNKPYSYTDRGFYTRQIERYFARFPRNNLLILKYDDVVNDYIKSFQRVCQFLSIDGLFMPAQQIVHAIPYAGKITPQEWHYLAGLFEDEITRLERLLGWSCGHWLRFNEGKPLA